jgi:hypothetical protein
MTQDAERDVKIMIIYNKHFTYYRTEWNILTSGLYYAKNEIHTDETIYIHLQNRIKLQANQLRNIGEEVFPPFQINWTEGVVSNSLTVLEKRRDRRELDDGVSWQIYSSANEKMPGRPKVCEPPESWIPTNLSTRWLLKCAPKRKTVLQQLQLANVHALLSWLEMLKEMWIMAR